MSPSRNERQSCEVVRLDEARNLLELEAAEAEAGGSGFTEHALRRLAAGRDELYNDRWAQLGPERLVDELVAGAADLGGCGCLALQALEKEPDVGDAQRDLVSHALRAAIRFGAHAHKALAIARAYLPSEDRQ